MTRNVRAFIGLGTNVGDRQGFMDQAVDAVDEMQGLSVIHRASLYETEPVGPVDQPWFLNTVVEVEASLDPHDLLHRLKRIERDLGRRQRQRWGPREIDLDLLLYGDSIIQTSELVVPHPELPRRRFVLVPLAELVPDVVHPELGRSVERLLRECADEKGVRPFPTNPASGPTKRFSSRDAERPNASPSSKTDG